MDIEVVDLKVRVHCKDCEEAMRKALCKIKGVKCVEINGLSSKIRVLGYMDRRTVIKAVRRTGRRAEVLPSSHRLQHQEPSATTPRMPSSFRCIIPTCYKLKLYSRH